MSEFQREIEAMVKALTPAVRGDEPEQKTVEPEPKCKRCGRTRSDFEANHLHWWAWRFIEGRRYCRTCWGSIRRAIRENRKKSALLKFEKSYLSDGAYRRTMEAKKNLKDPWE